MAQDNKDKSFIDSLNIAAGNVSKGNTKPEKTDGVVTRGNGAATKGTKARDLWAKHGLRIALCRHTGLR